MKKISTLIAVLIISSSTLATSELDRAIEEVKNKVNYTRVAKAVLCGKTQTRCSVRIQEDINTLKEAIVADHLFSQDDMNTMASALYVLKLRKKKLMATVKPPLF